MNSFDNDNKSLALNFESDDCVFLVPEPVQSQWSKVCRILSSVEFSPKSSLEITSLAFRKNLNKNIQEAINIKADKSEFIQHLFEVFLNNQLLMSECACSRYSVWPHIYFNSSIRTDSFKF